MNQSGGGLTRTNSAGRQSAFRTAASLPPDSEQAKQALAEEIARVEAELERKRLQSGGATVKKTGSRTNTPPRRAKSPGRSTANVSASNPNMTPSSPTSGGTGTVLVRRRAHPGGAAHTATVRRNSLRSTTSAGSTLSKQQQREQLEAEIRAMEAAIAATATGKQQPQQQQQQALSASPAGRRQNQHHRKQPSLSDMSTLSTRSAASAAEALRLQEEIRKMEAAIAAAKADSGGGSIGTTSTVMTNSTGGSGGAMRSNGAPPHEIQAAPIMNTSNNTSDALRKQEQLQQEIAAMEAAIAAAAAAKQSSRRRSSRRAGGGGDAASVISTSSRSTAAAAEAARLQAEIRAMEAAIQQAQQQQRKPQKTPSSSTKVVGTVATAGQPHASRLDKSSDVPNQRTAPTEVEKSATPARSGLFAALTSAVTQREKRIKVGDKPHMRDHKPEVEAQKSTTPQLSFSMAELITKKARDREKRLEAGGEKKMTKIKEKAEYKKDFSTIVLEAASMGRLTRLNEHIVEAVAREKTPEEEWKSRGLLAIQWRSNHMSVVHEAARTGAITKMREQVVSNFPVEQEFDEDFDDSNHVSPRKQSLLDLNKRVGQGGDKVERLLKVNKEENAGGDSLLIKPMIYYNNIDDVQLPKATPPKIDPKRARDKIARMMENGERPMIDISQDVATIAWERRTRLDRPGNMPRIKEKCSCIYCGSASPYQTFAYRERERRRKENPDLDEQEKKRREEEALQAEIKRIEEEMQRLHAAGKPIQTACEFDDFEYEEETVDEFEILEEIIEEETVDGSVLSLQSLEPQEQQQFQPPSRVPSLARPSTNPESKPAPAPPVNQGCCACTIL